MVPYVISTKKAENEIFKIISQKTFLNRIKNLLSFQLTSISGNLPTLKDEKIHNLSLTRIEKKENYRCKNRLKRS